MPLYRRARCCSPSPAAAAAHKGGLGLLPLSRGGLAPPAAAAAAAASLANGFAAAAAAAGAGGPHAAELASSEKRIGALVKVREVHGVAQSMVVEPRRSRSDRGAD